MSSLFLAAGALFLAWIVHLTIWRWRLPRAQLKALLVIFAVVWALAALSVLTGFVGAWSFAAGWFVGFLYFCLIYWSAAFCYVITYSAMEGDSPTLSLMRHLHRKGEEGVSHEEIEDFFRQRPFVGARVRALVTDNVFLEESGGYRLASGKYLFFRLILGYRRVVFGPIKSGG
jgi:small-conductance mechanosensitive channel